MTFDREQYAIVELSRILLEKKISVIHNIIEMADFVMGGWEHKMVKGK